ncbi:MAG: uroporphyrinogen-III synthase [Bradyrhizobium sp.]|uniref:uroporphyrinogen-III synthase n=1 Tax=Bradyrhizobium sp. TaxID=376 RepID=UPI001D7EED6C|nr:uroporphyrinogen-III synthase [Bradyrhizobium sp.]MBV9565565.1 uroporphyrinogen-III synthase [Bradyrhizobium sp.]
MAVLVTRPHPDNEATSAALRARGFEALLAPMLRFEPLPFRDDGADIRAVIASSANAIRAAVPALVQSRLLQLPLYAVGKHTAAAAREAGFVNVISADKDAAALRDLIIADLPKKKRKQAVLLYLAGADLSRDLAGELGERGLDVVTVTTYRMVPLLTLPRDTCAAFRANGVEAVLHYSARTAQAFVEAVRGEGLEISALALPQCCISATVASVLHEAGAMQVSVAASPDESGLLGALERALRPSLA